MSNKEIEKQAEELIEKHKQNWFGSKPSLSPLQRRLLIKAAIVSCEFAIRHMLYGNTNPEEIKAYLEGLL